MKKTELILFLFVFYSVIGISQENKETNSISGRIYMGDNFLQEGKIFLISNSKSTFSTFGNTAVNDGKFNFEDVELSEFSLYVIPNQDYDFFFFPKYLPTYLGEVSNWQKASIYNKQANKVFDIHLNKYSDSFYGNCKISGNIKFEDLDNINNVPIVVFLLNESKVPMDFREINNNDGTFIFDNLPEGKYFIHVEIPGFSSEDAEIEIQEQGIKELNFKVDNNSIRYVYEEEEYTIKPILTNDGLNFFIENNTLPIVCELADLSGRIIFKKIYSTNEIFINTSNITTGIYLLRARTYTNSLLRTTKVYINNN